MRNSKGKMEMRYYDVPQGEYLIALYGDAWKHENPDESGFMHFHNMLEIGICRTGSGTLNLDDKKYSFCGGMISFIPPNYPHTTESREGAESFWEYLFIDVDKLLRAEYPDDILFQQKILEKVNGRAFLCNETDVPQLAVLAHQLLEEMSEKEELYRESVKGMALSFVVRLVRLNSEAPLLQDETRHKVGFDQICPALDYIRDHYADPIKISDIAEVCHMSESHFRRIFKESIDLTPVDYLNQVRVRKAFELIRQTEYSMEEVAIHVGFTTTSTFNRNFKRITGTSPYQWKKQTENYENKRSDVSARADKGC